MHTIKKLALASALTLCAVTAVPSAVEACGGYGAVSEEDRARSAVVLALHQAEVDMTRVGPVDVTLRSADRGVADVTIDDSRTLRLSLIKRRGRWTVRQLRRA